MRSARGVLPSVLELASLSGTGYHRATRQINTSFSVPTKKGRLKVEPQIRHRRMGPGLDVALCGARGLFMYANTQRYITCEECKTRHAALRGANRHAEQMAAKRAYERALYIRGLWGAQ